jgi:hypothetical protein
MALEKELYMETVLQLNLRLASEEEVKQAWAFAKDRRGMARRRRRLTFNDYKHLIITACSKEARILGVKAGMAYEDAKTLIPEMKVFVIGARNV